MDWAHAHSFDPETSNKCTTDEKKYYRVSNKNNVIGYAFDEAIFLGKTREIVGLKEILESIVPCLRPKYDIAMIKNLIKDL